MMLERIVCHVQVTVQGELAYPYKISIQHELKPADSLNQMFWLLCHSKFDDILVFDTFFFNDEAWFHLDDYINMQNYRVRSSENSYIFQTTSLYPQKIGNWASWVTNP